MSVQNPVTMALLEQQRAFIEKDFFDGKSLDTIAKKIQCSRNTISRFIRQSGLKRKALPRARALKNWTDEDTETLVKLWKEGKSSTEIRQSLTRFTRNAIIGRVHRLGLKWDHTTNKRNVGGRPKKQTAPRKRMRHKNIAEIDAIIRLPNIPNDLKSKRLISIMELNSRTCRFPIGHPRASNFGFCGEEPLMGSPYCMMHDRMSYIRRILVA